MAEVNIGVLENEITHIKDALDKSLPKIDKIHNMFIKGEGKIANNREKIKELDVLLNGNGKPGIIYEISQIKNKMAYYGGALAIIFIAAQIIIKII